MATTITTFKKSQLGVEDIHFDSAGSASTANTPTSNGGTRQVRKINASHIPATTATRAKTDAAGTALSETNVDTILQQLLDDNAAQGIPDGVTLQVVAGVLSILSVGNAALATDSVNTAQIVDDAVTTAKIVDLAVTAAKLAANAVTTNKILDANVIESKIADGAVTNDKIADGTVKVAKMLDVPTHYILHAEQVTSSDAAVSSTFTLGMSENFAAGMVVQATMVTAGTSVDYIKEVAMTVASKNVEVTFGTAMTAGTTTINFTVLKAVTP